MGKFDKTLKLVGEMAEKAAPEVEQIAKKSNLKYPGGLSKEEYMAMKLKNQINGRRAGTLLPSINESELPPIQVPTSISPESGPVTLTGPNKLHSDLSGLVNYKKSAKGLMPLGAAAEGLYGDLKASPLGDVATQWSKIKGLLADKAAKQMDLSGGKDPEFQKNASGVLSTALDPVNLIPGAGGIAAGAAEMLARDPNEETPEEKMKKKLQGMP